MRARRLAAALFAVILLASPVAGFVAPALAASSAPPDGFVTVPDKNVGSDYSGGTPPGTLPTVSDARGNVLADEHASDTKVVLTTRDRALGFGTSAWRSADAEFALKISDDTNHDGRRVAIAATLLEDGLGYRPGLAYVRAESGETYESPISYEDGYAVFRIEHFSTNTITFSGVTEITATATDGSEYTYNVSDLDSVSDYDINLTGVVNSETEWHNGSTLKGGQSYSVSVAGNKAPTGPNGNPSVRLEGSNVSKNKYDGGGDGYVSVTNGDRVGFYFENPPSVITGIQLGRLDGDTTASTDVELRVTCNEQADSTYDEGTYIGNVTIPSGTNDPGYLSLDQGPYEVTCSNNMTLEYIPGNSDNDKFVSTEDKNDGITWLNGQDYGAGGSNGQQADFAVVSQPENVTVKESGGDKNNVGDIRGSPKTVDWSAIDTSTSSITVTSDSGGEINVSLNVTERSVTEDPKVWVNGNETSYTGTLSDGTTTSLTTNTDWVKASDNNVTVTFGASLAADAPALQVDLDYNHNSSSDVSVDFTGEKWTESYNVSRTYDADTSSAELTIPFDSGNVVHIRTIEKRTNGGSWSSVSASNYELNGTTLTVQFGSVSSGDTVELRADGSKVNPNNATISVQQPTTTGSRLDSKVKLDSWASDSYIAVNSTDKGMWLHYTYDESWSADEHVRATGSEQYLYLPSAGDGSTFNVSYLDVELNVQSGDVNVSVQDTDSTPEIDVDPGKTSSDEVEYIYHGAQSGETWLLYSKTNGIVRDRDTAESPVYLLDDDSDEVLVFKTEDGGGSGDGGGGGGGGAVVTTSPVAALGIPLSVLAALAGLIGLAIVAHRYIERDLVAVGVVATGGLVVILVLGEAVSPDSVLSTLLAPIGEGLGQVSSFAGLVAVGLAGWYVYANHIKGRDGPTIEISGRQK